MNQTEKPAPSKRFRARQCEVWRLLEVPNGLMRNAALSIAEELEAEFVHAWGLVSDTDGASLDMKMMAARNCDNFQHCFDHCTCYYEAKNRSHVVVTQPYRQPGEAVELLRQGLVIPGKVEPEIIAAPEWAFYYPFYATLIVVKFPPGYERILKAINRLWSPTAQWSLDRN